MPSPAGVIERVVLSRAEPAELLARVDATPLDGLRVAEAGPHYRILTAPRSRTLPAAPFVAAFTVLVLVGLLCAAFAVPWVLLIVVAPLLLVPLALRGRSRVAITALGEPGSGTVVTLEGHVDATALAGIDTLEAALSAPPPGPDAPDADSADAGGAPASVPAVSDASEEPGPAPE